MEIEINTYDDLLEFINRPDVPAKKALEVSCAFLRVIDVTFEEVKKENVIKDVTDYINRWCHEGTFERPIFLCQLEDEFSIKDLARHRSND